MCDEKITVPLCKTKLSICTLKTETNVTLMSIDIVLKNIRNSLLHPISNPYILDSLLVLFTV